MYYYSTTDHGILELKSVPPRGEDGIQYIPRSSGVDGIDHNVILLEDTPEEAIDNQLCWQVECILDEMCYYRDIEVDIVKAEELWNHACELVLYYNLYVDEKGKVSSNDDFGEEHTWFKWNSKWMTSYFGGWLEDNGGKVDFPDNSMFPGDAPTEDTQTYYYYGGPGVGIKSSVGIPRATEGVVYVLDDSGDYDALYDYDLMVSVVRNTPEEVLEDLRQAMADEIPYERGLVVGNGDSAYFLDYEGALKYLGNFEVSADMYDALAKFNPETHYMLCETKEGDTRIELCLRNQDG
jgi:hypothetical protein